jgi:hypothetical protein
MEENKKIEEPIEYCTCPKICPPGAILHVESGQHAFHRVHKYDGCNKRINDETFNKQFFGE